MNQTHTQFYPAQQLAHSRPAGATLPLFLAGLGLLAGLHCASGGPFVFATAPGSGRGNCISLKDAGPENSPESLQQKLEKQNFSCVRREKSGAGTLLVCNRKQPDGSMVFQAQASGKDEAECKLAVGRLQELQKAIHKQNRI